jgi:hypothetical protein
MIYQQKKIASALRYYLGLAYGAKRSEATGNEGNYIMRSYIFRTV